MSLFPWKEEESGGYERGHWQQVNTAATCHRLPTGAEAAACSEGRSQEGEGAPGWGEGQVREGKGRTFRKGGGKLEPHRVL